ncbi:zinc finger protein 821 isoform X2 [Pleurodeles waltl]|uniref:zinc finger protein 821 isoform X2 n=1 Tax=Pleurodeles waltl TaxID=8319 RepID=UPI0037097E83
MHGKKMSRRKQTNPNKVLWEQVFAGLGEHARQAMMKYKLPGPNGDQQNIMSSHLEDPDLSSKDDGSPADMPVQDNTDDMDVELTNISQQTLQEVLETLQTPSSVTRRSTELATITEDPPRTPIVRPASSNTAEDSDDPGTSFERTVVGVQRELAKEVRVGMQTMAASLEGVHLCMMSTEEQAAAMQGRTTILQEVEKRLKEISTAIIQLTQHLQQQYCQHVHECNIKPLRADLAAYHCDVAAILKNQQILLPAVLPLRPPQLAATGMSDSTSTLRCVLPLHNHHHQGQRRQHTHQKIKTRNRSPSHVTVPGSTSPCHMATYYQGPVLCNMPFLQQLYSNSGLQNSAYLVSLPCDCLSLTHWQILSLCTV